MSEPFVCLVFASVIEKFFFLESGFEELLFVFLVLFVNQCYVLFSAIVGNT